jgi:formamidopyrimidine-DNA glycosylase
MPELPEVETIASYLREGRQDAPSILNCTILDAQLLWQKTLATPGKAAFLRRIKGKVIHDVSRRGKFLVFNLGGDWLLFHLRMSGDILVQPMGSLPAAHDRLLLYLDNQYQLVFNDTRKFGRVWLVADLDSVLGNLGLEPLQEAFTPQVFYQKLHSCHRQLKPLLLDQSFLAGLGNIYTDEALHRAKIHPRTRSDSLDQAAADRLWMSIRQVLQEGIRRQGASIDWVYRGGSFQDVFQVYQRTGQPCPHCGSAIDRIQVGQRSTHFCPVCQTESP